VADIGCLNLIGV